MEKRKVPVIERSLFSWAFTGKGYLQVLLIITIVVTVFARVLPLEMQKRIINQAIKLNDLHKLMLYCGIYLAAVVGAVGLRFLISVLQTVIGNQALAEMRKALYYHILTLPLSFFRKTQPGMVVASLVSELAISGGFIGQAIAIPFTSILTLMAFAGYLMWLNTTLAAISFSIYPVILIIVPRLQVRVNRANKDRVDTTRQVSSLIGESITGIHEIHGNGAYDLESRKFNAIVDKLKSTRIRWNIYKFAILACNQFLTNLGQFVIFLVGGYLVMNGQLELGALVAFLSAQEKLYEPWKELMDFYQIYQDASVRYQRTIDYYRRMPEHAITPENRDPFELVGQVEVRDLSFTAEGNIQLLEDVTFSLKPGEHMAMIGFSGSGKSTLAQCIGQLYKYTSGTVLVGNQEVSELTKKDIVRNIGFVSQDPFIFTGTIEENLLYAFRAKMWPSEEAGNEDLPDLDEMITVLQQTGLFVDVLRFGLNTIIPRHTHEELTHHIINVRRDFYRDYAKQLDTIVEFFNVDQYQYYSSVAENLIFGTAETDAFETGHLSENTYFMKFLEKAELKRPLLSLGSEIASQVVDILGNLPPDTMFFEQSPVDFNELEEYKLLMERLKRKRLHQLSDAEQKKLLKPALRFIPAIHKIVSLPKMLEHLILEGRSLFRERMQRDNPGAISFFDMSRYSYSQTILNNILFGKTKTNDTQAREKIDQLVIQLLIEEDFLETIVEIGMQFHVGSKGDRLSGGQRQKLAIARTLLKAPPILIMDEATSALDNKSQARIQRLLETRWKGSSTLIAVVHRLDFIKNYDRIAVLKSGKIEEMGTYEELMAAQGILYELITGKH